MSRSAVENIEAGEIRSISKNKHTRVKLNKTSVSSNELEENGAASLALSFSRQTIDSSKRRGHDCVDYIGDTHASHVSFTHNDSKGGREERNRSNN